MGKGVYTYSGNRLDYLPQVFPFWVNCSTRYIYGLYVDGELVAASCDSIVDFGKTRFGQGLRVSLDHRNKRYTPLLDELLVPFRSALDSKYPIERIRKTRGTVSAVDEIIKKEKGALMCIRSSYVVNQTLEQLNSIFSPIRGDSDVTITIVSAKDAFEFAQGHSDLFPCQAFYTDWDIHEVSYENFLLLETGGYGNFQRQYLKLVHNDTGNTSFAIIGKGRKEEGMTLIVEVFTKHAEEIPLFCKFVVENSESFRTSLSLPPVKLFWLWAPYELESTRELDNFISLVNNTPKFHHMRALFFEEIRQSKL